MIIKKNKQNKNNTKQRKTATTTTTKQNIKGKTGTETKKQIKHIIGLQLHTQTHPLNLYGEEIIANNERTQIT